MNPEMLQSIMKIAPLLSSVQQEDDNTRLLYALRPFLKPSGKNGWTNPPT